MFPAQYVGSFPLSQRYSPPHDVSLAAFLSGGTQDPPPGRAQSHDNTFDELACRLRGPGD